MPARGVFQAERAGRDAQSIQIQKQLAAKDWSQVIAQAQQLTAGARLAPLQTRTWKIGVMYPTVFPGAVRVTLTGPSVEEELGQRCVHIRDNGVRVVTALQPVAGGFFLQGVDRDDVQSGDVVEAIMPAAPKDRVEETGKLPALRRPVETRLVCDDCFERATGAAPGALA